LKDPEKAENQVEVAARLKEEIVSKAKQSRGEKKASWIIG
jgi:hypothetical protein